MNLFSQKPRPLTKGVARVPVVMQLEALECGAASLTMIMHYYQKWIPLEERYFSAFQIHNHCHLSLDTSVIPQREPT